MSLSRIGKYEIRGALGRGAMGVVYDGWDPVIGRRVAIKTIALDDAAHDEEAADALERFRREAQAAGRMSHANIVGVFDAGETDALAYIVMEFVEGRSLKAVVDADGALLPSVAAEIMAQVLAGLEYSHKRQVVHRDIKPANILLTTEGVVKIADFGIARISSSTATVAGTIMGTPAYMPPEQFLGEPADARSDIYAAGATLFHLLTGSRPYEGTLASIMTRVIAAEAPPCPSERGSGVGRAWDQVIARAMARGPADRFQTAAAFAEAVRRAAGESPEPEGDATIIAAPQRQAAVVPVAQVPGPPRRGLGLPAVAGGLGLLLVAGGAGAWFLSGSRQRLENEPDTAPIHRVVAGPGPALGAADAGSVKPGAGAGLPAVTPHVALATNGVIARDRAAAVSLPKPSPETRLAGVQAAIAAVPCTMARAAMDGETVAVTGLAGTAAARDGIGAAVRSADATASVGVDDVPEIYCPVLDTFRPLSAEAAISLSVTKDAPSKGKTYYHPHIGPVPFDAWVRVDDFRIDGGVEHLVPTIVPSAPADHRKRASGAPLKEEPLALPAGSSLDLGEKPHLRLTVQNPTGIDLITAVAAAAPGETRDSPFNEMRPVEEPASDYLKKLSAVLLAGGRHAAGAVAFDTSPAK
jgi:serine/threonine-protein kinase